MYIPYEYSSMHLFWNQYITKVILLVDNNFEKNNFKTIYLFMYIYVHKTNIKLLII